MVEQIKAFKTSDGKLFASKGEADRYEAVKLLDSLIPQGAPLAVGLYVERLVDNAKAVVDALTPIANRVEGES